MTPEQQRIAIAKAAGITAYKDRPGYGFISVTGVACKVPDYVQDLNAMHEAEETLNENRRLIYSRALVDNFRGLGWQFDVIHATSAQRAEAFLKTLGLWKD